MTYENVRVNTSYPNLTVVGGYYYNLDHNLDTLVAKTSDGNTAFSYPLDTVLTRAVVCIEYTGSNINIGDFWTMEDRTGTPAEGVIIRQWRIDNYILKLQKTITLTSQGGSYPNDKFQSDAFTLEHYHPTFGSNEAVGQTNLQLSSTANITAGTVLCLGPSTYAGYVGEVERVTVTAVPPTTSANTVNVTPTLTKSYSSGDPVSFYRNIWLLNDYYQTNATGGLYKIDSSTNSILQRDSGGEYNGILACTFYDDYLIYMKADSLIYINVSDSSLPVFQSAIQDNREASGGVYTSTIIPVYELSIEDDVVYRLQAKATYRIGASLTTSSWSTYNYQMATLTPFVTSVSVSAAPSIIAADGVSTSALTITVRDQFNSAMSGKLVNVAEDDSNGGHIQAGQTSGYTGADGEFDSTYVSGTASNLVTITATVSQ